MAPRYGSYSKAFSDNWKYLSEGDWRREEQRFKNKYEEEMKDWERYGAAKSKQERKFGNYLQVKKMAEDVAKMAAGVPPTGDATTDMAAAGGGGEGFGKTMESFQESGLMDFAAKKFISEKFRPEEMLKEFEFANMDVKGFARYRKSAGSVQKEFDAQKKQYLGQSGPKVMDYFDLGAAAKPWQKDDTEFTPTSGKYDTDFSGQTSQSFDKIMSSAGVDTSGIESYQDLRMKQLFGSTQPSTTVD